MDFYERRRFFDWLMSVWWFHCFLISYRAELKILNYIFTSNNFRHEFLIFEMKRDFHYFLNYDKIWKLYENQSKIFINDIQLLFHQYRSWIH